MIETGRLAENTRCLLDEKTIAEAVARMAEEIARDYRGQELVLVCVLKGSMMLAADLMRRLPLPVILDFIAISSYGDATETSGVVSILKDLEENIRGRHVLVVEDIVDTGLTLQYLVRTLQLRQPASLRVCALLEKPARRRVENRIDYLGFTIEDYFVVGYGLDYAGRYRQLPFVGIVLDTSL
ncbi:MAG TPA: hypoxanthine phosphoribosyltransferase [Candidatus Nitrosotenuis sp.]|nr:hypoxanthine phosphoribosyltransferase [Candidatus Nitrosotenuis sp.]